MLKDVKQDLAVHKTETGRQRVSVGDHIFNVEDEISLFSNFIANFVNASTTEVIESKIWHIMHQRKKTTFETSY